MRPDMVMEVLGIRQVGTSLLSQPVPMLRFNNAADAYMVDWQSAVGRSLGGDEGNLV